MTPFELFGNEVRYVVPLFQRPYVWDQERQWEPRWDDVRVLAEQLEEPGADHSSQEGPSHFLGAIVLDQAHTPSGGFLMSRSVIDGQQRLTTLQLLLDAAAWVVQHNGHTQDAAILRKLVMNDLTVQVHPDDRFKVWPTNQDRDAFRAVMDDDADVSAEQASARIAEAHRYFCEVMTEWCEPTGDPDKRAARLHALTLALVQRLRLVSIDLEPGDNAQVIFETLNHRGTPLLAADLIKNLVFQRAEADHLDVQTLYDESWATFDSKPWRREVRQGRIRRPRVDMFFNHWLVTQVHREVTADRIFSEFRSLLTGPDAPAAVALLDDAAKAAKVYDRIESYGADTVDGRFRYRVIEAMETTTVMPLLLWLYARLDQGLTRPQLEVALESLERYLVRRMITGASTKPYNRLFLDLLQHLEQQGPANAGDEVQKFLAAQTAATTSPATDDQVRTAIRTRPLFTSLKRSRVRLLLEALEEDARSHHAEIDQCPKGLTIEHVLPQNWSLWPLPEAIDPVAGDARRAMLVHTLGNLTLATKTLNPKLSNFPWNADAVVAAGLPPDHDGVHKGKRDLLQEHTTLRLNLDLTSQHPTHWSEEDIEQRSCDLADRLIAIWASA